MGTLAPGQMLGKYRLEAEIGRGGMGVVYRAYDPALKRRVAIKVLPAELTYDRQFVARFQQEAVLAAQLRHPGIVTIHDVGEQAGVYYIVMEHLEGETLEVWLRRRSAGLSVEEAAAIIRQVASALDYAHSRGVIHRDIKPANIMMGSDGGLTIMDFGLVRAAEGAGLTRTGIVMGTPEYMSPEQGLGEPADARSDVYSLGVVLYRMLSGKAPFSRTTPYATTYAHVNEPPPPLRLARPDLPASVEAVVNRALAKPREARYQRAGDLSEALSAVAAGRREPATPRSGASTSSAPASMRRAEPTQPAGRSKTWAGVALGIAAVVVLGAAFILVTPQLRSSSVPPGAAPEILAGASTPEPGVTFSSDVVTNTAQARKSGTPARNLTPVKPSTGTSAPAPTAAGKTKTAVLTAVPTATGPRLMVLETVNVRSGPGTVYPRLGSLSAGQTWEITGRSAAGDWWQIRYNLQPGWVAASFVDAAIPPAAVVPVVAAPPPPSAPVSSSAAIALSLAGQENSSIREGYVGPPTGNTNLGGVSFDLRDGATVTSQASTLPDNPTRVWLPVGRSSVKAVYLLLTGGNLYARFDGKVLGRVRLLFDGGRSHSTDLIAGVNVREWKLGPEVVTSTRSATVQEVWQGATREGQTGIIDMLHVAVPSDLQSLTLSGVEVLDLSTTTTGEMDPALNVLGASAVVNLPTPTPAPVACSRSPGPSFGRYSNRAQMGCALGAESRIWSAYEPFERGWMLWRQDVDRLYAFYSGGFRIFQYPSAEPPEFWCTDAQAAGDPRRGFSRVWCDNPDVRNRVGAALARETGGERAIQEFENGFLVFIGERGTAVWVDRLGVWTELR